MVDRIKHLICKMPKKVKLISGVILVLILLYLFVRVFSGDNNNQENIMTVPVKRGNIEVTALATGIVKPYRLVAVGARATGRIISLKVKPGSLVKEGDLLAEIDPTTQENDLKNQEAVLASNKAKLAEQQANLALARQNLQRQQNMINKNAVSRADLESAENEVKVRLAQIDALQAEIEQSEVQLATARVNLSYTRVTAPFDGTVLATVVQEGQNVNAVQSAPTIAIIGNLTKMTIRAQISEADIVNVKIGQPLYFSVIGNPDRRYNGVLEDIEPAPESIRDDISFTSNSASSTSASTSAIYYNGIFDIDNKDGQLRTYMTAEVNIILGQAKNVLLVAADGLGMRQSDGSYLVKVLEANGSISERKVKIGLNDKVKAQVLSGLAEGDEVITASLISGQNSSPRRSGKGLW